jgi:glycosyltransferase involved in cell wall biosynthesis
VTKATPRALIIEPSGNLWGSERVLLDFLRQAINSEWQLAVCCPLSTPIIPHLSAIGVRVFPTFIANLHLKPRAYRALAIFRLLAAVWRFQAKLIYVNQAGATRIALAVGRLLRVPVVTHVRLVEDVTYIKRLNADARYLPKIICISKFILSLFGSNIDQTQTAMIYDPYALANNRSWHAPVKRPNQILTVCCVGRLTAIKGQDVLLHAIALLKSEGFAVRLLILGEAPPGDQFVEKLKKLAEVLGITDVITWLGYREDVFSSVQGCDVQVCPSHSEPLGRVLFEAWDAGILPIAWRGSGGSAEVIESSGGGLLYDEQSGESLAGALRLASDIKIDVRRELIGRGREWVSRNCDPKMFASAMFNLWRQTLDSEAVDV